MEAGKTYTQSWVAMGCQRSATFQVISFSKNGSARGIYTDADGKQYNRHFVKPGDFSSWVAP